MFRTMRNGAKTGTASADVSWLEAAQKPKSCSIKFNPEWSSDVLSKYLLINFLISLNIVQTVEGCHAWFGIVSK
jgi:hypothetical protein